MKTLCIVPCGSRKIWDENSKAGPTKAKYVYIGPFAKECREYAEKFYPSSWCILSAKYGFLFPDDIVRGPYNVSFNDRGTKPIRLKTLSAQLEEKGLDRYKRVVVLGGKDYTNIVTEVFSGREIYNPLRNCKGIGYMMGKLNNAIKRRNST